MFPDFLDKRQNQNPVKISEAEVHLATGLETQAASLIVDVTAGHLHGPGEMREMTIVDIPVVEAGQDRGTPGLAVERGRRLGQGTSGEIIAREADQPPRDEGESLQIAHKTAGREADPEHEWTGEAARERLAETIERRGANLRVVRSGIAAGPRCEARGEM